MVVIFLNFTTKLQQIISFGSEFIHQALETFFNRKLVRPLKRVIKDHCFIFLIGYFRFPNFPLILGVTDC